MSVYTQVSQSQLIHFLSDYDVGQLSTYQGVLSGIENTNFFVDTDNGQFVLTLFEQLNAEELPYFLEVMAYFSNNSIPSANPVANTQARYLGELNGKPATLVERLTGSEVKQANGKQCASLGKYLAKMHQVSGQFKQFRSNGRGLEWCQEIAEQVMSTLSQAEKTLLKSELTYQAEQDFSGLPIGVIHGDLFRDNALFVGDDLNGIIDFYYACNDYLLYDVAVTVNDWCIDAGKINQNRLDAFMNEYQKIKLFNHEEKKAWSALLRRAALRFWLGRLLELHFPRGDVDAFTHVKDPNEIKIILQQHINCPQQL